MDYFNNQLGSLPSYRRPRYFLWFVVISLITIICVTYYFFLPPTDFPMATIVYLEEGQTLKQTAATLEEAHFIRSKALFQTIIIFLGGQEHVNPGYYSFKEPLSSYSVAQKILKGIHGIPQVKVTIPEGLTRKEMSLIFTDKMDEQFSKETFLKETEKDEGYLFPETYFFYVTDNTETVVKKLRDMFIKKTDPLFLGYEGKLSQKEIIVLASLIEEESNGDEDRALISGILQNRLKRGDRLQVDATVRFALGNPDSELTLKNLQINSPYNTYVHTGLPPGPISNPGVKSIDAALHPEESPYLFYLHDLHGRIYYAKTYAEHLKNKQKYLK